MKLDQTLQRLGGDEQLLMDLIGFYLEDYAGLLDRIDDSLKEKDAAALENAAHSLKGLIANFNDDRCRELAQEIESAAKDDDFAEAATLAPEMRERASALAQLLSDYRYNAE